MAYIVPTQYKPLQLQHGGLGWPDSGSLWPPPSDSAERSSTTQKCGRVSTLRMDSVHHYSQDTGKNGPTYHDSISLSEISHVTKEPTRLS